MTYLREYYLVLHHFIMEKKYLDLLDKVELGYNMEAQLPATCRPFEHHTQFLLNCIPHQVINSQNALHVACSTSDHPVSATTSSYADNNAPTLHASLGLAH